jgi:serine/threonine protein kinase
MNPTMVSNAGLSGELYCPSCERQFSSGERCPHDGTKLVRLASTIDPFLGKELEGRYTIVEKLGQGGMGAVYRGNQHSVGRDVAIKVVTPALVSNPEVIKRFLRECKLSSRLSHPNAVGVLDFGQTSDGVFFMVMEMVQGRTLDDVIESEKKLRPERVIRIGMQICDALEGAHAIKIIHRDLKPSNVMLMSSGRDLVKVLDFGLAKSLAPDSTQSTMTNAGVLMGTPAFMPPELATGAECDGRADLYSLGCMLYYMGSGQLPFYSESIHELVTMHATLVAPPMPDVPPSLGRVVDRMLLKKPSERYQTAAENREALEEALLGLRESRPVAVQVATADDTRISLGPSPALSSDFDFLKSEPAIPRPAIPQPPAIPPAVTANDGTRNRKPTNTEQHRAAMSETFLGDGLLHEIDDEAQVLPLSETYEHRAIKSKQIAVAAPALPSSPPQHLDSSSDGSLVTKKSNKLLFGAIGLATVVIAIVVIKMAGGASSETQSDGSNPIGSQSGSNQAVAVPTIDAAPQSDASVDANADAATAAGSAANVVEDTRSGSGSTTVKSNGTKSNGTKTNSSKTNSSKTNGTKTTTGDGSATPF